MYVGTWVNLLIRFIKRGIEGHLIDGEIQLAHVCGTLGSTVETIHATVLPFHTEWTCVADVIECDDDVFKVDIATTNAAEIPETTSITEISVTTENANAAIAMTPPHIFHVCVVNLCREGANEFHVVHALVAEVGGIVVEAEALVIADRIERALCGYDVKSDFCWMNFESEIHILFLKYIKDGGEAFGKIIIAFLQIGLIGGREGVECTPNARAREAIHHRFS